MLECSTKLRLKRRLNFSTAEPWKNLTAEVNWGLAQFALSLRAG